MEFGEGVGMLLIIGQVSSFKILEKFKVEFG